MKKVLAILLAGVLCLGVFAGCGNKEADKAPSAAKGETSAAAEENKGDAGDDYLIGISVPKASTGWTAAITYYAEKYCEENGINYKIVQAESTNDQANQVDDLISQKPDAIVMNPMNDELATAAQKIMDEGIILVNFDRTLGGVTPDYYYAGNNPQCGAAGADWMVEKLGTDFSVAIISATSWGNIAEERKVGFQERLKEIAPDAKVVGEYASESASQEDGLKIATDVLTSNPELDAIFLVDDEQACGALQAINEANRTDIKALYAAGGGAATFLNKIPDSSFPIATVTYYPTMICDAIQVAVDVIHGETRDAETIETPVVIDADNLEEVKESLGVDPNAPY